MKDNLKIGPWPRPMLRPGVYDPTGTDPAPPFPRRRPSLWRDLRQLWWLWVLVAAFIAPFVIVALFVEP